MAKEDSKEVDGFVGQRLRALRHAQGLTQRALAAKAGVPHGQISMIEGNRSSPSIASLRKIVGGLGLSMTDFFDIETSVPREDQVFFSPKQLIELSSQFAKEKNVRPKGRLSLRQVGDAKRHNLQILYEVYEPGADSGPAMLEHESTEGGIVVAGEVEVTVGDEVRILKSGDAFLFNSRQPHRFRNISDLPATVITACTPPYL
jgi:transcriptional regulator with XRE-family HTH domain